tara:strand:+ start:3352 stop:3729 length:378 start_codon:yes stop_codon:yes gene_type:complete
MNPFEFITAINDSKKNIMDSTNEKNYNAFVVNRSLSYFPETVLYANEMNFQHHIDSKLQFDFLINIVRKKRRFAKWAKPIEIDNIECIKEYYGYSNEKAKSVLTILSDVQIEELKKRIYKGGKRK